jgi:hypothetical protein
MSVFHSVPPIPHKNGTGCNNLHGAQKPQTIIPQNTNNGRKSMSLLIRNHQHHLTINPTRR